jgi:hypothetical protein
MISPLLSHLSTDPFNDEIGFVLPPVPMRRVLQRSPAVRALEAALRYGLIAETELRGFVSELMRAFRPGEVFQHDVALAALAVAMEHWHNRFAEEYLLDLARVQRSEFRCSFRVARECLKARYAFPRTEVRTARYPQGVKGRVAAPRLIRAMPPSPQPVHEGVVRWVRYSEVAHASD